MAIRQNQYMTKPEFVLPSHGTPKEVFLTLPIGEESQKKDYLFVMV